MIQLHALVGIMNTVLRIFRIVKCKNTGEYEKAGIQGVTGLVVSAFRSPK